MGALTPRSVCVALVLAALIAVPCALVERSAPHATRLSEFNRLFVTAPSYAKAISRNNHRRPPLYQTLLYATHSAGIPLQRLNQALFASTLVLLLVFARRRLRPIPPLLFVAFYSACSFNLWILGQLWSEALVVPLALATLLALDAHGRRPRWSTLVGISLLVSLSCLTRTFCAFWLAPIAGARIALAPTLAPRNRALHALVYATLVLAPLALWFGRVYQRTGYWTGMDRWPRESRPLLLQFPNWPELTGWGGNLQRGASTLFLDFFSPTRLASHEALASPFAPSVIETSAALLGLTGATALLAAGRHPRGGEHRAGAPSWIHSPGALLASLVTVYLVALEVLWSVSNNDPLWSRFLLPCYVFAVAGIALAYGRVAQRADSPVHLGVARACFGSVAIVQLWRRGALLG